MTASAREFRLASCHEHRKARKFADGAGITGHTIRMKTAVSLPDELFERVERCARRLKLSRSGLIAAAAREFLAQHDTDAPSATEAWNRALAEGGQPGSDPAAVAAREHSARLIRQRLRERW